MPSRIVVYAISVGDVAQTLLGVTPSASAVSRLNQTLTQQFEAWRERPLQAQWRVLYLDSIHFKIRHGEQCDTSIILTMLGVDLEGKKEVLALRACAEEEKEGWLSVLQDIRTRGASGIWKQETKEDALLNLSAFKAKYAQRYREAVRPGRKMSR